MAEIGNGIGQWLNATGGDVIQAQTDADDRLVAVSLQQTQRVGHNRLTIRETATADFLLDKLLDIACQHSHGNPPVLPSGEYSPSWSLDHITIQLIRTPIDSGQYLLISYQIFFRQTRACLSVPTHFPNLLGAK
jgi:hypothetical protein